MQGQPQVNGTDWGQAVAERDEKIAALEAQVAEAAKNAETAERLRGEIAELKAQGESDRIDFQLQLAGRAQRSNVSPAWWRFRKCAFETGPQGPQGILGETGATGVQGPKGDTGMDATIAGTTASVDYAADTPSVSVTLGDMASARTFAFASHTLKGEIEATGPIRPQGLAGTTLDLSVYATKQYVDDAIVALANLKEEEF